MEHQLKAFHWTAYGMFGAALPTDAHGFCYLTVWGWEEAGYPRAEAKKLTARAKEQVAQLEKDIRSILQK